MHSLLGAIMCSQDYNYGQSSYGRCTATGCRCPSMLYLLSGAECTCSSRRGVNRWPDSGRVLYACAPRYSKDLALRMQCVRNTERNRAPLSRFLGFNMTCMAGADREPFWLPRKACMPVQMTVSQNRVKPVHLGLDPTPSSHLTSLPFTPLRILDLVSKACEEGRTGARTAARAAIKIWLHVS